MAEKKVIIEIEVDKKNAETSFIATEKAIKKVRDAQALLKQQIKETEKANGEATDEQIKELRNLESTLKSLNNQRRRDISDLENSQNSIQSLRNEISKLTTEYNNLDTSTSEGIARFNVLQQRLKELNSQLKEVTTAAGNFKENIGNYAEGVKEAINSSNVFGISIGQLSNFFKTAKLGILELSGSLNFFKLALIGTGIGAIIVLLGSFITYITQSQQGVDRMAQTMAKLKQALQPVVSLLSFLGNIIFNVFAGAVDIFVGITDAISNVVLGTKNASNLAGEYVKGLQNVEREIKKQEVANSGLLAKQEALKNIRDNELNSFAERTKANDELGKIIEKQLQNTLKNENLKLEFLKKQLELKPQELRTDEDILKVQEQEIKINEILSDIEGKRNEQITNQVSLIRDRFAEQTRLADAELSVNKLKIKGYEGSAKALQDETSLILKKRDEELKFEKDSTKRQAIALEAEASVLEKKKEFNELQLERQKEFLEKQKELQLKALDDEIAVLQVQALKFEENTKERLQFETAILKIEAKKQIIEVQGNQKQIAKINAETQDAIKKRNEEVDKEITTKKIENEISSNQILLNLAKENSQEFFNLQKEALKKNADLQILSANENAIKIKEIKSNLEKELLEIDKNAKISEQERLLQSNELVQKIAKEGSLLRLEADLQVIKSNRDKNLLTATDDTQKFAFEEEARQQQLQAEEDFRQKQKDLILKFGFDRVQAQNAQELSRAFTKAEIDKFEVDSEAQKLNAIGAIASGFGALFGKQSEIAKVAAGASALINTYTAITQVLADPLVPFFAKIPSAIGIGVAGFAQVANIAGVGIDTTDQTAGLSQIASGVQTLNPIAVPNILEPPKFNRGGIVSGLGTTTSDSIDAKLSTGESIINAVSTQAFAPVLSAINVAGGGVPFPLGSVGTNQNTTKVKNNFDLESSFTRAVQNLPNPQVSVIDIQNVTKAVNVKESATSL